MGRKNHAFKLGGQVLQSYIKPNHAFEMDAAKARRTSISRWVIPRSQLLNA